MGNDMAGPGGKGRLPLQLVGKNIASPERARELGQIAAANRARRKAENGGIDPWAQYRRVDGRLSADGLNAIYVSKAFVKPWDEYYLVACRKLRKQYAPRGSGSYQYEILLRRAAALDTLIQQLETMKKPDRYLTLSYYERLQGFIAQLQKYTEAEKREVRIEEQVTITLISQIIGLADATITDPAQRGAFLRALRVQLGDESARLDAPSLGLPVIDVAPRAMVAPLLDPTDPSLVSTDQPPGVAPSSPTLPAGNPGAMSEL